MIFKTVIAGYGKIGKSLNSVLLAHQDYLKTAHDIEFHIVAVVDQSGAAISERPLDLSLLSKTKATTGKVSRYPKMGYDGASVTEAIDRVDADLLIELTPTDIKTGQPATNNILHAFERGMDVITTNKGALALHYRILHRTAGKVHREFKFRGAAFATIPCINMRLYSSIGPRVQGVEAILNATSNYVLTEINNGLTKDQAIRKAESMGLTEHDPRIDLDGWDTACKLVILTNLLFKKNTTLDDVEVHGISSLEENEIIAAKNKGLLFKPLGEVNLADDGGARLRSYPKALPASHLLGSVSGKAKAVVFHTQEGEVFMRSDWAGSDPSAYAIVEDAIELSAERRRR